MKILELFFGYAFWIIDFRNKNNYLFDNINEYFILI